MASRSSSRAAHAPARAGAPPKAAPRQPGFFDRPTPSWAPWVLIALSALLLLSTFTTECGDPDAWWHLKTGQYIVQQHKLPVPDPFAWTTYMHNEGYPGEQTTRRFNLTHEWLAQAMMYLAYAGGGFGGLVLLRALWLTLFCALAGAIAWRRTRSYYCALGVAFAVTTVLRTFVADRPQYVTYAFLTLTILILESRRRLWLLPPLFLIWANCHAGFFMGWVALGAYCAEALYYRLRGKPLEEERRLWIWCIASLAISGVNPNVYNVIPVLRYYRQSPMQSAIWEWQRPKYWEISPFTILLYGSAALLLARWRKTRPVDWMLLGLYAVAGLLAMRNIILVGFWGPILVASYAPRWEERKSEPLAWGVVAGIAVAAASYLALLFSLLTVLVVVALVGLAAGRKWPRVLHAAAVLLLAFGIYYQLAGRYGFQLRGALWRYPEAAADFLRKHHIQGRIFNTYGQGGYLIWRLWPEQQVFIDGRALNEKVYDDAKRISGNADNVGGKSGEELLKEYGIDVIVTDGFDSVGGGAYYLPAALADPAQKEWKLVYQDLHDVIYMRNPPPDVPVLQSLDALTAMERQCQFLVDNGQPLCSRGLVDVFGRIGDRERYTKWLSVLRANRGALDAFTYR